MEDSLPSAIQGSQPPAKKSRGPQINWTETLEEILLASVCKREAYYRTDETLEKKWALVQSDMLIRDEFSLVPNKDSLSAANLRQKFTRLKSEVEKKYSLKSEGSNLSQYEGDQVSRVEKMVIAMLKKEYETKGAREAEQEKNQKRNQNMLQHEEDILSSKRTKVVGGENFENNISTKNVGSSTINIYGNGSGKSAMEQYIAFRMEMMKNSSSSSSSSSSAQNNELISILGDLKNCVTKLSTDVNELKSVVYKTSD